MKKQILAGAAVMGALFALAFVWITGANAEVRYVDYLAAQLLLLDHSIWAQVGGAIGQRFKFFSASLAFYHTKMQSKFARF